MVVITIIGILMAMLSTVATAGRRQARQTDCRSNLRQIGIAILVYRGEHNNDNPPWLSNLYPEYVDDLRCFVCKSDRERGMGPVRPDEDPEQFPEVKDNKSASSRTGQNADYVKANSYFYEFSNADCSWKKDADGNVIKWWEAKENQMRYGDDANGGSYKNPVPYSQSKLPIVRCYHHQKEGNMRAFPEGTAPGSRNKNNLKPSFITINIAYAGNVYVGPLWWEGLPDPGEK